MRTPWIIYINRYHINKLKGLETIYSMQKLFRHLRNFFFSKLDKIYIIPIAFFTKILNGSIDIQVWDYNYCNLSIYLWNQATKWQFDCQMTICLTKLIILINFKNLFDQHNFQKYLTFRHFFSKISYFIWLFTWPSHISYFTWLYLTIWPLTNPALHLPQRWP